jgi:hypothetical protein
MMTLLKRAFLRTLEQQGYLLPKKAEYAHVPEAVPTSSFEQLVALTESVPKYALRTQELEQELLALRTEIATNDYPRLQAEHAFYFKRVAELEEHNRQLTQSATKYSLRVQKLERAIGGALPDFDNDDGTLEFASASGVYVTGAEAPLAEDRLVTPAVANPAGTTVILTFGQSNAANSGEERYAARGAVHVFNVFDMRFYRAVDPLPGASHDGGSVWGRVGDKLIDAGRARSILIVPIALAQRTSRIGPREAIVIGVCYSRCIGSSRQASRSTRCAGIRARQTPTILVCRAPNIALIFAPCCARCARRR